MRYKDTRDLKAYLNRPPSTLTLQELNHFDNLCRSQLYDLSCLINHAKNNELRDSLFLMNIERFQPKAKVTP